jgi:4-hydroxybenzoate polyprenyltransferase
LLKKAFNFFIFTSLFIACCAVLMVHQAFLLFGIRLPPALYFFVFSGSVCSYNFHWFLTPPHTRAISEKARWNITNKSLHLLLAVTGIVGAAISSFLLVEHWFWLGVTALLTFLYSAPMIRHPLFLRLRSIAVGKTIYLAFAWTHITALLPIIISVKALEPVHSWYVINRFFFLYAICIVFDRRDRESDRRAGIKSMVTLFDEKGVDGLFWSSQLLVLISGMLMWQWFPVTTILILLLPAVLMSLLYSYSKRSRSDYLYYFLLDGLMALSAPILILAKFAR